MLIVLICSIKLLSEVIYNQCIMLIFIICSIKLLSEIVYSQCFTLVVFLCNIKLASEVMYSKHFMLVSRYRETQMIFHRFLVVLLLIFTGHCSLTADNAILTLDLL